MAFLKPKGFLPSVGFDDRLETILAQPEPDRAAVTAKWRQLLDLLARHEDALSSPGAERALGYLRRHRPDVPPVLRRQFAAALPRPVPAALDEFLGISPGAEESQAHIGDLIARVEALRKAREPRQAPPSRVQSFRWETGSEGVILWIEGAPRGPLVGQSIASPAGQGDFGVDGQAAGAFARRAPFRDARLIVPGEGEAAGDWRISGVPYFDPAAGSFLGYRGSARRPRIDENAAAPPAPAGEGMFGTELEPDSLRQLIHELRTPLNAILGFAEMIDAQILGPAADGYRARAVKIREQAGQLLSAVDDLDTAARIETHRLPLKESAVDTVALLERLYRDYEPVARQRNARLRLDFAAALPPARVEPETAERMLARMLSATIGLAQDGETLSARLGLDLVGGDKMLSLSIARPRSIAGVGEAELLDPGYSPDGDWPAAPTLGLGFTLRLVRNLAEAGGGSLEIEPDRFRLCLCPLLEEERNGERA